MPIDESFAEAVERLQAGEQLDAIVAHCDLAVQDQLHGLLLITEQIGALALSLCRNLQPSVVMRSDPNS